MFALSIIMQISFQIPMHLDTHGIASELEGGEGTAVGGLAGAQRPGPVPGRTPRERPEGTGSGPVSSSVIL